jgi:hypothetical protein
MISIYFPTQQPVNLRFAFSPLLETATAYHLLRHPFRPGIYDAWAEEVQRALYGVELPFMDAVILPRYYVADFLTLPPPAPRTDFEAELANMLATPAEFVQDNIRYAIEVGGESEARDYFLAYPSEALHCLVDELRLFWQRAIAHYWSRMLSVLENDVLYRARMLAIEGAESVINHLHPIAHYEPGVVKLDKQHRSKYSLEFHSDSTTLALVPSAFITSSLRWQVYPVSQPMLNYPMRGGGLWYSAPPQTNEALEITLGEGRARVFIALRDAASTGELARQLHLTAGAVSQHLGLLKRAGLIESHRSGHHVFHRLSERGEKLIALFA